MSRLLKLSEEFNIAIVITNQVLTPHSVFVHTFVVLIRFGPDDGRPRRRDDLCRRSQEARRRSHSCARLHDASLPSQGPRRDARLQDLRQPKPARERGRLSDRARRHHGRQGLRRRQRETRRRTPTREKRETNERQMKRTGKKAKGKHSALGRRQGRRVGSRPRHFDLATLPKTIEAMRRKK